MFWRFAVRDGAIIGTSLLLACFVGPLSAGVGPLSDLTGVVVGFALGAAVFVLHEWGHLVGALLTRSHVLAPPRLTSVFLFSFDSKLNTRRQFLIMSATGFVMTGLALWGVYALPSDEQLATRVARGLVLFLVSLTVLLEFPAVIWACVRSDLPPVETFSKQTQA